MKSKFFAFAALLCMASAPAHAATVNFDSLSDGTVITGSDLGGVSVSAGGSPVEVVDMVNRAAVLSNPVPSGMSLRNAIATNPFTNANAFRADFSVSGVSDVSVGLGDFGADRDNLFLRAFSAAGTLLDSASSILNGGVFAFMKLSVSSASDIAYVEFGSTGAFDNSIFADDLEFTAAQEQPNVVPVPAALPLLAGGLGLMGLVGWRRKRKTAA